MKLKHKQKNNITTYIILCICCTDIYAEHVHKRFAEKHEIKSNFVRGWDG